MQTDIGADTFGFLQDGGNMGAFIRAHVWTGTPLGLPAQWPQALRTAVRLILNTGHPMYIFWGPDSICLYNDAYSRSIGPERHPTSLGQPGREVWAEIWDIIGPQIAQVMAGGGATWHENHLVPITRDGRREDVYWTYSYGPIDDDTAPRGVGGVLVVATETTKQVLAERRAVQERERLWRSSQDLLIALDKKGTFVSVSPSATTILDWLPEEMVGRSVFDFILPEDASIAVSALSQAGYGPLPITEVRYRHKDGGHRWLSWVAAPEGDLIFATGRHVTAEKEATAALAVIEDALRQSQKMEAVGQLTGGLAHDFNNLLAVITGSLELLERSILRGRQNDTDRFLNAAQTASKRAAALTHRLLAFSRRQTLDPKATDSNRLIAGMDDLIRRTVGPAITVEIVGAAGLWNTLVDPHQLENALLNLCINARDAMPDGGRLTIETANRWLDDRGAAARDLKPGQYASVCVSDTGTGMPPNVIARAFEPFFTTKPIGQGTGLGLSMIYGFARQSNGQVRIYSEMGKGTTLCIYLPRHLGEDDATALDRALPAPVRAENGHTVLVVDDEPGVRMLVIETLDELGYYAIEAGDGPSAMKVVQSDARLDLLVTDVGLPGGMNGRQVADAARAVRPGLKVLFITGYAENAAVGNGHLDPGMAVMTKPFAMDALAHRIRDLITSAG